MLHFTTWYQFFEESQCKKEPMITNVSGHCYYVSLDVM